MCGGSPCSWLTAQSPGILGEKSNGSIFCYDMQAFCHQFLRIAARVIHNRALSPTPECVLMRRLLKNSKKDGGWGPGAGG